jgi:glutathione S-transferase
VLVPEAQNAERLMANQGLNRLDDDLEGREFICDSGLSMADIILYAFMAAMNRALWINPPDRTIVAAWFERMSARESGEWCQNLADVSP